ncbi:hypothetical protein Tco_1414204, partial [Tanacetum coccineum]
MVDLTFADSHNMVAYLEKSEANADFAEIVDFLNASSIRYALIVNYSNNRPSVRRDLYFDDEDGITCITNTKIFENLQLMGYEKLSDKLTFLKPFFSPQWKYLIHTVLQCLSSKSIAWNEYGPNIASAAICLAKNQKFNFSKLIFDGSRQPTDSQHPSTTTSPSTVVPIPVLSSSQPKKTQKHRKTKRKATEISQSSGPTTLVADETIHKERGDNVERAATTATSLDAKHGNGNINRTQSTAIPNYPFPQGTGSGGSPRRQDTILGDRPAQTRFERLSKQSNDPPLLRVNTLGSGEDSMKLKELMELCTKLSERVLALENIKTAQDLEIPNLKKRVKKLEKKKKSRTPQLKRRLFKVRIESSVEQSLGDQEDKQGRNKMNGFYGFKRMQRLRGVELDEKVRLEREREEEASNAALIEEWDTIEARIDA